MPTNLAVATKLTDIFKYRGIWLQAGTSSASLATQQPCGQHPWIVISCKKDQASIWMNAERIKTACIKSPVNSDKNKTLQKFGVFAPNSA